MCLKKESRAWSGKEIASQGTELAFRLRNSVLGSGTCTEGPNRDGTGTDVADGVADPASIGKGFVARPPGCTEERAFMGCVSVVL